MSDVPSRRLVVAVLLVVLAGGVAGPAASAHAVVLPGVDDDRTVGAPPSSSRSAAAAIRGEAWVPVPGLDSDHDGRDDRVRVRWRLPAGEPGPVPVVVEPSPYYAGTHELRFHDVDVDALHVPHPGRASIYRDWLLPRGYGYVTAESLGTAGSTGCPSTGDRDETAGMVAVVRWLTGELTARDADGLPVTADWSNGRVGMIGVSYNGTLPNAVAATGVEGLDAIVPVSAISDWYDYYRSQGTVRAPGGYQGEDADVLARAVLTRQRPAKCRDEIRAVRRGQARRTGDLTPFWQRRDYRADAARVTAGVLTLHGTRDDNVFSDQAGRWAEALAAAGAPVRSWWHTGRHGDWLAWEANRAWRRMVVAWFDHFLRDADNGVLDTPASTLVTPGGATRTTTSWPGGEPASLYAGTVTRRQGRLRLTPGTTDAGLVVDDARFALADMPHGTPRRVRVLWRSRPLARALELSGHGTVDVEVSVDAPAGNLSVGLVVLGHRRGARLLGGGWADPQNHASLAQGEALVPGRRYLLTVELDQVLVRRVAAGRRLGLVVAASDHDHTLRPPPGTRLRIHTQGTRLVVPVVGGADALRAALARPE